MKDLVRSIASALADEPRAVRVRETPSAEGVRIALVVARDDLGMVIGKGGRTARAIRTLLAIAGRKAGRPYTLEIDA